MSTHPIPQARPRRAAVLGASIAGLLAARALADHFDEVVLLERDLLPDEAAPRKGTPQAVHPHGLLARGQQAIEALCPGFTEALLAQGAVQADIGLSVVLDVERQRLARRPVGFKGLAASRLAIEAQIRRMVLALPNVAALTEVDVLEPVHEAGRVTGVRWRSRDDNALPQVLEAALVVDATGRGSRSPQWLGHWGYEPPVEERVEVGIAYATAYYRRDDRCAPPVGAVICPATPGLPRPAVLIAQEPDAEKRARWTLAYGGYAGDHVLPNDEGLRARARDLASPELQALVEHGERLSPVLRYHFPHSQRRRYERLGRFPQGYLVVGDALASFNPVYGQGMTVAACEAELLHAQLARHGASALARRFFRAASRVIDTPWQLAVGSDLALDMVPGPRPLPVRIVNAYVARLMRAAVRDAEVTAAFVKVMHMLAPPPSLFAPRIAWRVLLRGGGRAPVPSSGRREPQEGFVVPPPGQVLP